jgi:hypothetical protein
MQPDDAVRCTGCGTPGRVATIAQPEDGLPVLRLVWTKNGPRLLCSLCEADEAT